MPWKQALASCCCRLTPRRRCYYSTSGEQASKQAGQSSELARVARIVAVLDRCRAPSSPLCRRKPEDQAKQAELVKVCVCALPVSCGGASRGASRLTAS